MDYAADLQYISKDESVINRLSELTNVQYSDEQREIMSYHGGMAIMACAGSGKALKNNTRLYTKRGLVPINEIQTGELVCDPEEGYSVVEGVYPQPFPLQEYIVEISDGTKIVCCKDHLWTYRTFDPNRVETNTTEYILNNIPTKIRSYDGKWVKNIELPVYYDLEMERNIPDFNPHIEGEKFITQDEPIGYLEPLITSPIRYRLDFLAGIVGVTTSRRVPSTGVTRYFSLGTLQKVTFLRRLCETIGSIPISVREKSGSYSVAACIDTLLDPDCGYLLPKYIKSIRKTKSFTNMTCIKVSSASGLFVLEGGVVTHNTTVLTHLLAKRIMTGEITDTSKLMCCTYSKPGATEMEERINSLFKTIGIKDKVTVKTLHAFYLMIMKHFGYNLSILDGGLRSKFIRDACRNCNQTLPDEDMQELDSLLSYQVNNLMSDAQVCQSYVYTLKNTTVEQYTAIHNEFTAIKKKNNLMDFDDLQLYIYYWMCRADDNTQKMMKDYVQSAWTDFYIDEAQDLSKIQMEILRKMCTNSEKIVFIGDDDQCLVPTTKIVTKWGKQNICDLTPGAMVSTGLGEGEHGFKKINNVSKLKYIGDTVTIKTSLGFELEGTPSHKMFIRDDSDCTSVNCRYTLTKNIWKDYEIGLLGDVSLGIHLPVLVDDEIIDDTVISVEVKPYNGFVYDISVPITHNFLANGILVHNCIYQWRGADPSLLIDINGYYDVKRFVLSTNYRCKAQIVNTAAVGIKNNSRRVDKTMEPHMEGGEIKIVDTSIHNPDGSITSPDLYAMTKPAYCYIKHLVETGASPKDIAVLSRNNQHLAILNNMLFKDGIYSQYSKDMRFTSSAMFKEIKAIIEMSCNTTNPHLTANNLWRLVPYLGAKGAKVIANFQEGSMLKFSDTLGYLLTTILNTGIQWELPAGHKIPATAAAQLRAIGEKLGTEQRVNLSVLYRASIHPDEYKRVKNFLGIYLEVSTGFMYKSEDRKRSVIGYVRYFEKMVKDWGIERTLKFLSISQQYEDGSMAVFNERINMSTMHSAKGKEWEHVILFGDDNVTFPSFQGLVELTKRGVSSSDIYSSIEEDRRLHYVAMTRAKSNLTIFTERNNLSVFTLEALGIFKTENKSNNAYILSMASADSLTDDLIEKSHSTVFNQDSPYHLEIDEAAIETAQAIEFSGVTPSNSNTLDLNICELGSQDLSAFDEIKPTSITSANVGNGASVTSGTSGTSISEPIDYAIGNTLTLSSDDDDEEYYE